MQLTPHFSLAEMTVSQTAARQGIDNDPDDGVIENLRKTCAGLERIRILLGHPIFISSGYRSQELNRAIGGSPSSAHTKGWAADFICPAYGTSPDIMRAIADSDIQFDQLIEEFGRWVHISFDPRNRKRVLRAIRHAGSTMYSEVA
jgi:zinc D-Ala-D-Ala carboxypeptidase